MAQLLLMRKKFETWYLWIAVDILSVGIYIYKEVYFTAGLFLVFMILCINGLLAWHKEIAKDKGGAAAFEAEVTASLTTLTPSKD